MGPDKLHPRSETPVTAGEPHPRTRTRLLGALQGPERYTLFARDVARAFDVDLEDALSALRSIVDSSAWCAGPFPGARVLASPELAKSGAVIAELPVGLQIPVHGHQQR
jgi:hypothetical protein